jgi:hypothetical protein
MSVTRIFLAAILIGFLSFSRANAQESPASAAPEVANASPATPTPSPTPVPVSSPARSVRISFLPPPLEGTISLGIYDEWNQLVRVLHQEAQLDEFTVGPDALVTKWDGKNDDGQDLPSGKYRARGYLVGHLKIESLGNAGPPSDWSASPKVQIKLMANPLAKNERGTVDLALGFDDENSFLKTGDGLPLFTINQKPNVTRGFITKNGEKSVDLWQDDGAVVEQIRVSNVDKMMAFDCGEFELK